MYRNLMIFILLKKFISINVNAFHMPQCMTLQGFVDNQHKIRNPASFMYEKHIEIK